MLQELLFKAQLKPLCKLIQLFKTCFVSVRVRNESLRRCLGYASEMLHV